MTLVSAINVMCGRYLLESELGDELGGDLVSSRQSHTPPPPKAGALKVGGYLRVSIGACTAKLIPQIPHAERKYSLAFNMRSCDQADTSRSSARQLPEACLLLTIC